MTHPTTIEALGIRLRAPHDAPVSISGMGSWESDGAAPLVEVFTASEQRARSSQAYVMSALGQRLRYVSHEETAAADFATLSVTQHDPATQTAVTTVITRPANAHAWKLESRILNAGDGDMVITAVVSFGLAFGGSETTLDRFDLLSADSEWCAEGRWWEQRVRTVLPALNLGLHGQDARGHFSRTSHGSWSTGEALPSGVLVDRAGPALGWQIETSAGWRWDLSQTRTGGVLSVMGPTDGDHQFAATLAPGDTFEAVPVAVVASEHGRDGVFAELTRYRRWRADAAMRASTLPVVYNDFMNTLMGQPSTEALLPLIDAAAGAGAEYFCIDAGWFADPEVGDWWDSVGEWKEADGRFSSGLKAVISRIHEHGMKSGLWLEPEVVGVRSAVADELPEDAFFSRFGQRVREHDRFHLDLRHPAARAHIDDAVDRILSEYGVSFLKLDYNINPGPGPGTDVGGEAPGYGLLAHTRAVADWMRDLRIRYPDLVIENCSSGAMRMDYALLSAAQLQSTSDQQDYRLYPPIAASAPASVLPEQCGNWAYPEKTMTDAETGFALVAGIMGRMYLSGFLGELRSRQQALVSEAVQTHKDWRHFIAGSEPVWPMGLPAWDDDLIMLGYRSAQGTLLAVWHRGEDARTISVPVPPDTIRTIFNEESDGWEATDSPSEFSIPGGNTARVFFAAPPTTGAAGGTTEPPKAATASPRPPESTLACVKDHAEPTRDTERA